MKTNVIKLNILHLNTVRINGRVEMQGVSLQAGEIPEPPVVTTYTLAANVSNGKVTATKNGTAISLPYVATEGDVIVLSVTPDEGYEFNGWLDGNKSNPRTVTMTGNVVLSASCVEIAKPTYTLSASVTNGKASATLNGSAVNLPYTANEGDTIVLEVTPNDGYSFEGWADGNTDNPRSITMTADVVLSAQCVEVVQPPAKDYIQFEDAEVERVLMSKGVSSDGVGITIEDAEKVTSIGGWFNGNKVIVAFDELRYFTGLSSLSQYAFNGCTALNRITLSNSINTIGAFVFQNCKNLQRIDIGTGMGSIGAQALLTATPLQMVICRAATPPVIANNSLNQYIGSIYVPDASLEAYKTATNWNQFASRIHPLSEIEGSPYIQFEDAEVERVLMANGVSSDGIGITKEDAAAVTTIGTWFRGNTAITSFEELKHFGITQLVEESFRNCTNLQIIALPQKATRIDGYSFNGCSALTTIKAEGVSYIGNVAFIGCSLEKANFPNLTETLKWRDAGVVSVVNLGKLTTLPYEMFCYCGKLKYCILPSSLTGSNGDAFYGAGSIEVIIAKSTTPPSFNGGDFVGVPDDTKIYVPTASVDSYKAADAWSSRSGNIFPISNLATDNPTLYAEIQQYL